MNSPALLRGEAELAGQPQTRQSDAATASPAAARRPTLWDLLADQPVGAGSAGQAAPFLEHCVDALRGCDPNTAAIWIGSLISEIDRQLGRQINAILHHPDFQKLEASWRGVEYLARCISEEETAGLCLKILSVSWRELERDVERAVEFDHSEIFRKVYESEFGTAGGSPFGLIIGDYSIEPRPRDGHPHDDISILRRLSGTAAAAFCPMIFGASPAMFAMEQFTEIERTRDLGAGFQLPAFTKWNAFRDSPDSRFIGLAAPRVLMRRPHKDAGPGGGFPFREAVEGHDAGRYLWGNAAFALGEVVIRAFAEHSWPVNIRGVRRGYEQGGLVTGLPQAEFGTDRGGVALRPPLDASLSEEDEAELNSLGFLSVLPCKGSPFAAFYSNPSVHRPAVYDRADATESSRFSAMLNYTLGVSRFAHYVKVIARDKVGAFSEPGDVERYLHTWLMKYVTPVDDASEETRARYPLRAAEVQVGRSPGKAGSYVCTLRLAPHYQLDEVAASLRMSTHIPSSEPTG